MNTASSNKPELRPTEGMNKSALARLKIPRRFEIFVEEYTEEDVGGRRAGWYPVKFDATLGGQGQNPVITVNSQQDLAEKQAMYKSLGQRFKIIREVDPPSRDDLVNAAKAQGIDLFEGGEPPLEPKREAEQKTEQKAELKPELEQVQAPKPVFKPRIVTIGDTQIKYDGDKVYRKAWLRLTPVESANFRVVNDSSNKVMPLTGRHIEAKRWVLVEESQEGADDADAIIND